MSVVGTSSQLEWKGHKLKQALVSSPDVEEVSVVDRLELVECDMLQDNECYYKAIKETKPDYVIHTACPFMQDVAATGDEKSEVNQRMKSYQMAT